MVSKIDDPKASADPFAPRGDPPRVIVLSSSPRRNGNSRRLAEAAVAGAAAAGHAVELAHLPDHVSGFLRDCRECRDAEGRCRIDDGFRSLFLEKVLNADAIVYATPIWWYGISGILKTFMDRMFCYIAHSEPDSEDIARRLRWKRAALILSAEESNFSARLAIVQQMQELCRYLDHSMVGIVTGIGNRRGDVEQDPSLPLDSARELGRRLFEIKATDYRLDTERSASVWQDGQAFPGYWR
jgi:multimeric flavodoxin WrbA